MTSLFLQAIKSIRARLHCLIVMYDIRGKVAVITGSGRGIGRATAIRLAKGGAKLVVNAKHGTDEVNSVIREISSIKGEAVPSMADAAERDGARAIIDAAIDSFGHVDILVNNVGLGLYAPFMETNDKMIDKQISVTLKSAIICSQEAVNKMNGNGCIINVVSLAGIMPIKGLAIYSAAKAGLISLTKSLCIELAPGIRVNGVAPTVTNTQMGRSLIAAKGVSAVKWASRNTISGSLVEPEEVAETIFFLAIMTSINGQTIVLDYGQSALGGFNE